MAKEFIPLLTISFFIVVIGLMFLKPFRKLVLSHLADWFAKKVAKILAYAILIILALLMLVYSK